MFRILLIFPLLKTFQASPTCNGANIAGIGHVDPVISCTYRGLDIANAFTPCSDPQEVNTTFHVFSKNNPDTKTVLLTKFDKIDDLFSANHFTVFVTHGWLSSINLQDHFMKMKDLFFKKKNNKINFVIVDWSDGSQNLNYQQSVANTRVVGKQIALFIEQLYQYYNVTPGRIILNGHSLGAQIMGIAAREVYLKLKKRVLQLNGEDPAGPCWETSEDHIQPTDAKVVQIFHTDADSLGTKNMAGQYDFYLNDGKTQPNCESVIGVRLLGFSAICDHLRVLHLLQIDYQEQKNSEICEPIAYQCESFEKYNRGECASCKDGACQVLGYGVQVQDNIIKPERIKKNDTIDRYGFYMKSGGSEQFCLYQFQVKAKCTQQCNCEKLSLQLSHETISLPSVSFSNFSDSECTGLLTFSPDTLDLQKSGSFKKAIVNSRYSSSSWFDLVSTSWSTDDASKVDSVELNYLSNRNGGIRSKYSTKLCVGDVDAKSATDTREFLPCQPETKEQ